MEWRTKKLGMLALSNECETGDGKCDVIGAEIDNRNGGQARLVKPNKG
jgi:hypothetical protein